MFARITESENENEDETETMRDVDTRWISSALRKLAIAGHCGTLEGHGGQLAPDGVVESFV